MQSPNTPKLLPTAPDRTPPRKPADIGVVLGKAAAPSIGQGGEQRHVLLTTALSASVFFFSTLFKIAGVSR